MTGSNQTPTLWPLAVYFAGVLFIVGVMLGLSYILGQKHKDRATGEPYESGVIPTGSARVRYDVKFYLNAMFFVLFDLETVFLFAWAVSMRSAGWAGYIEVLVFVVILFVALIYLWRMGALDWETLREKFPHNGREE